MKFLSSGACEVMGVEVLQIPTGMWCSIVLCYIIYTPPLAQNDQTCVKQAGKNSLW